MSVLEVALNRLEFDPSFGIEILTNSLVNPSMLYARSVEITTMWNRREFVVGLF
jgi:hypothetical protein